MTALCEATHYPTTANTHTRTQNTHPHPHTQLRDVHKHAHLGTNAASDWCIGHDFPVDEPSGPADPRMGTSGGIQLHGRRAHTRTRCDAGKTTRASENTCRVRVKSQSQRRYIHGSMFV
jgi:hypothetical protein